MKASGVNLEKFIFICSCIYMFLFIFFNYIEWGYSQVFFKEFVFGFTISVTFLRLWTHLY